MQVLVVNTCQRQQQKKLCLAEQLFFAAPHQPTLPAQLGTMATQPTDGNPVSSPHQKVAIWTLAKHHLQREGTPFIELTTSHSPFTTSCDGECVLACDASCGQSCGVLFQFVWFPLRAPKRAMRGGELKSLAIRALCPCGMPSSLNLRRSAYPGRARDESTRRHFNGWPPFRTRGSNA